MNSEEHGSLPPSADKPPFLRQALEKYQQVKEKMEECAYELATVSETVRKGIAAGITLQHAKKVLARNECVEDKVQECAGDLNDVNKALATEVDYYENLDRDLDEISRKLSATQDTLSRTQHVLAIAHEVAEEAKLRALRDFATGIANRELFNDRLEQALGLASRNHWVLAVMFIDLDRFKPINDEHGHTIGDKVLQMVAQRLDEQVRSEDTVCRYGGDEFLYLLVNPQGTENIERIAGKVIDRISQMLVIDDLALTVEPSIGIAVYPDHGRTGPELVANADAAMYQAKKLKSGFAFFDKDHSAEI